MSTDLGGQNGVSKSSTIGEMSAVAQDFVRPYVVSWNLTYRCNLACEHCYLDAGSFPMVKDDDAFADRRELTTEQCYKVIDDIAEFAPEALTILTGGEPLLRRDILDIVRKAHERGLWVVVGTNGVRITPNLSEVLKEAGVRGLALSLDALDPKVHDGFRRVTGAWENTVKGAKILKEVDLPFIVQTTAGQHNEKEINEIANFAYEELGASVWNLYFLVPTGRGQFVSDLSPERYDRILAELGAVQKKYTGRMVVNAKCAPHFLKHLLASDPDSPFLKSYTGGAGGCPAGTHYLGIRPNGDVTPCPYLPTFDGNLKRETLKHVWDTSELFQKIRKRNELGGRCGECELSTHCGGCRARAFGVTGDYLAEDPLCTHTPGTFEAASLVQLEGTRVVYGNQAQVAIEWDADASEKMKRIPAFVRGMVIKRVEAYCAEQGLTRVTLGELEEIRSRMPVGRPFAGR